MCSQENLRLAQQFLEKMGSGASADEISALCAPDLEWDIPGDSGVLPWVGHKTGREAISDFVRDTQTMIERISFEIRDVLASFKYTSPLGTNVDFQNPPDGDNRKPTVVIVRATGPGKYEVVK